MFDMLVRRGRVVSEDGVDVQSIVISDGRVAALISSGDEPQAREVVEASNHLICRVSSILMFTFASRA